MPDPRKLKQLVTGFWTALCFMPTATYADKAEEITVQLVNPNSPLATLNFKFQHCTFDGDIPDSDNQSSTTLLLQPALPFPQENDDTILFSPTIPLVFDQSVLTLNNQAIVIDDLIDFETENGVGNTAHGLAFDANDTLDETWMSFAKLGWSHADVDADADADADAVNDPRIYDRSTTLGGMYYFSVRSELLGVAINYGELTSDGLGAQTTTELLHQSQLAQNFEATPSIQLLKGPA